MVRFTFHKFHPGATASTAALMVAVALAAASVARAQSGRVIPVDLINVAAAANGGHIVNSSSTFSNDPTYGPENLIDGQVFSTATQKGSNGWASDKFDPINMDYVTIGFKDGATKRIGKLVFNDVTSLNPERWAKDIEVQVSTDSANGPFFPVAQITLQRTADRQAFSILPASARFVRLMFRSNWGSDRSVSLGEVEMYEAIDSTDQVGGIIARLEGAINDLQHYKDTEAQLQNSGGTRSASAPLSPVSPKLLAADFPATGGVPLPTQSGGNIAAASNGGRIVDYSSIFEKDPKYGPDNLIDGQHYDVITGKGSYGWSSEGFVPGKQYVTIGFKDDRTHVIGKVTINPESNQSSLRWASRVEVDVTTGSPTDGPFQQVATLNLQTEFDDKHPPINQDFAIKPVEAKYVRFLFMANGPGNPLPDGDPNVSSDRAVSLGEVEIYEPPSDNATLSEVLSKFNNVLIDLKRLRRDGVTGDAVDPATAQATPVATPAGELTTTPAEPGAETAVSPATKPAAPPVSVNQTEQRDTPANTSTARRAQSGVKAAAKPGAHMQIAAAPSARSID